MAIPDWSTLTGLEQVRAYLHERFPLTRFAPLPVFLLLPAAPALSTRSALLAYAALFCLILEFRIWDDLADVPHDGERHPERLLVRSSRRLPVVLLATAAALGASVWTVGLTGAYVCLTTAVALRLAALAWYCGLRRAVRDRMWASLVVICKYPFLSCYMARCIGFGGLPWSITAEVYLAFCTREALDQWPRSGTLLHTARALLAALLAVAAFTHGSDWYRSALCLGLATGCWAATSPAAAFHHRIRLGIQYPVFTAVSIQLLLSG